MMYGKEKPFDQPEWNYFYDKWDEDEEEELVRVVNSYQGGKAYGGAGREERYTNGQWIASSAECGEFEDEFYEERERLFERFAVDGKLTVYRGFGAPNLDDVNAFGHGSWTLDKETAKFFATRNRYSGVGERNNTAYVATAQVSKDYVVMFMAGRNEDEVLIDAYNEMNGEFLDYIEECLRQAEVIPREVECCPPKEHMMVESDTRF